MTYECTECTAYTLCLICSGIYERKVQVMMRGVSTCPVCEHNYIDGDSIHGCIEDYMSDGGLFPARNEALLCAMDAGTYMSGCMQCLYSDMQCKAHDQNIRTAV